MAPADGRCVAESSAPCSFSRMFAASPVYCVEATATLIQKHSLQLLDFDHISCFAFFLDILTNSRRTIQLTQCPKFGRHASPVAPSSSLCMKPARAELQSQAKGTAKLGILICTTASTSAWLPRFSMLPREDKRMAISLAMQWIGTSIVVASKIRLNNNIL